MQKYHISSRILHWLMAIIIIFLLGLGIYMTDFLNKEAANRMEIYNLHKSLGVLVLILVVVRIINQFIHQPPQFPSSVKKIEKIASHFLHLSLYFFMILIPLSGYLMSNSFGYPVALFGYKMPFLIGTDFEAGKKFATLHEISAFALIGVLAIHLLATAKHFIYDRELLKRMF